MNDRTSRFKGGGRLAVIVLVHTKAMFAVIVRFSQ